MLLCSCALISSLSTTLLISVNNRSLKIRALVLLCSNIAKMITMDDRPFSHQSSKIQSSCALVLEYRLFTSFEYFFDNHSHIGYLKFRALVLLSSNIVSLVSFEFFFQQPFSYWLSKIQSSKKL